MPARSKAASFLFIERVRGNFAQESEMKTKRADTTDKKNEGILASFARTIGSTIGNVAANTDVFSKPARRRTSSRKSGLKSRKARKRNRA
jgi:hypothetical protein